MYYFQESLNCTFGTSILAAHTLKLLSLSLSSMKSLIESIPKRYYLKYHTCLEELQSTAEINFSKTLSNSVNDSKTSWLEYVNTYTSMTELLFIERRTQIHYSRISLNNQSIFSINRHCKGHLVYRHDPTYLKSS